MLVTGASIVPFGYPLRMRWRVLAICVMLCAASAGEAQPGKITDYKVAAQRLYAAWRANDRRAALRVATPEAVDKLLSVKWRAMRAKGCQRSDEGVQCVYEDPKLDLRIAFEIAGGVSAGYGVAAVSFSSEE